MKKLIVTIVVVLGVGSLIGCQPTPVDYTFCEDVESVRYGMNEVQVTRNGILVELNEDLDEMAAESRCPGYGPNQMDRDG